MAKPRPVNRHDSERDLAEPGFSGSGASVYSRNAAHGQNTKLPGYREGVPGSGSKVRGPRSTGALIAENIKSLAKLERNARQEKNPIRLQKLLKSLEIKKRFLETLRQDNPHRATREPKFWNWETVDTIPGEFEV